MTENYRHFGPTDPDALHRANRLLLYVEREVETQVAMAAAITSHDPGVDVVTVTSSERAESVLSDLHVDCLVVGDVEMTDFLGGVDIPVALYTDLAPSTLDERLLAAADTFIERRSDDQTSAFLARKVLSLMGSESDQRRTQYALARALSRTERDDDHRTDQFLVDDDGSIVWASSPLGAVFPIEESETARTATFDERLHALLADSPDAILTVTRTKRDANPNRREAFTLRHQGTEAQFVHTGYRLPPALDSLRLEVFEHVTPSVRRDARLELLELVVEASQDGLYTLDAHGNIDFCNERFAEMLDYDREALIGRHASDVLVEGELQRGQSHVATLMSDPDRDRITVDLTFRTRTGTTLDVAINFTLLPTETDTYAGLMGVARDITKRKRRERRLQQYRQLVESARDPMFVLDAEGRISLCNDALERVVETETLAGRRLTTLFSHPDSEQIETVLRGLRTGESEWEQYEIRLADETNTERLYEATVGALRDDDDGFAGTVGTLRDITERDQRTHELDLLKQVLTRVLRHNIRSKLTVIQSHSERLVDGTANRETAGKAIRATAQRLLTISEKARRIERLVESDIGRTTLDLSAAVAEAVDTVSAEYPEIECTVDVPSVPVRVHPEFAVAVENAVENAAVHTTDPSVSITASTTDSCIELRIADDGPGIPETELETIEQREETQLQHTSGAGLWLMDWVMVRSDGTLTFETGSNGTTVEMVIDRVAVDRHS